METIVVQPLFFLFCAGIVVPAKPFDAPDTPCENPLTGKNVVKAIQKELDRDGGYSDANGVAHDGMNYNYMIGRYFDPVIGGWISLDPKEQFWSGYSYAGNGYNPVNAVDPDGKEVFAVYQIGAEHTHASIAIAYPKDNSFESRLVAIQQSDLKWGNEASIITGNDLLMGFGILGNLILAGPGKPTAPNYDSDVRFIIPVAPPKGMSQTAYENKITSIATSEGVDNSLYSLPFYNCFGWQLGKLFQSQTEGE